MRKLCVFSVGAKDINKNVNCKIVFFGSPKFARFIGDYHNEYRANKCLLFYKGNNKYCNAN